MLRRTALALLALAGLVDAAEAQALRLPQIGIQDSGGCRQLSVKDPTGATQIPIGCVDTTSKLFDGSAMQVKPTGAAAASTLPNLLQYAPTLDGSGNVKLGVGPTIGSYTGGKYSATPDVLNVAGRSTTGNIVSNATPQYSVSYGYQPVSTGLSFDVTGINASAAEHAGVFKMTSTAGGAGTFANYKMALGAQTFCDGANSAPCWGMTTVVQGGSSYDMTKNSLISHEFNLNNFTSTDCGDTDYGVTGHPCGLTYVTMPPNSKTASFGYAVAGAGRIRNGFVAYSAGPIASDFRSYSQSQNMLYDTGQHANGINAGSATYSGAFIIGPSSNFVVYSSGAVTSNGAISAPAVTSSGNLNGLFVQFTPLTYGTLNSIRPCSNTYLGLEAYVTDSTVATYNTPVAGGGTNKIKVHCNGTQYVSG